MIRFELRDELMLRILTRPRNASTLSEHRFFREIMTRIDEISKRTGVLCAGLAVVLILASCSLDPPAGPSDNEAVVAVAGGAEHACALQRSGAAWCWGSNVSGELGNASASQCGAQSDPCSLTPQAVNGGESFVRIAAGGHTTCALRSDGLAFCWGNNDYGQLGDGTTESSSTPVPVQGGHHFVSISVAAHEVCGISNGQALCWGSGAAGALGTDAPDQCTPPGGSAVPCSLRPVQVASPEQLLLASAAGSSGACALTISRIGICWGLNSDGRFGTAIQDSTQAPTPIPRAVSLGWISSGSGYTCIVTETSFTRCVGSNRAGQLGVGDTASRDSLETIAGAPPPPLVLVFTSTDSTTLPHTCGLTSSGAAWCWGNNQSGQLGVPTQETCSGGIACSTTPQVVTPGVQYGTMSVGGDFTCAVSRGIAFCWGANDKGQLGTGDNAPHGGPVQITLPTTLEDD